MTPITGLQTACVGKKAHTSIVENNIMRFVEARETKKRLVLWDKKTRTKRHRFSNYPNNCGLPNKVLNQFIFFPLDKCWFPNQRHPVLVRCGRQAQCFQSGRSKPIESLWNHRKYCRFLLLQQDLRNQWSV